MEFIKMEDGFIVLGFCVHIIELQAMQHFHAQNPIMLSGRGMFLKLSYAIGN